METHSHNWQEPRLRITLALALCAQLITAQAATLTVVNLNDSGDGSLRAAIAAAASGDTIIIPVTGTITLTTGALQIGQNLTVSGPGANVLMVSGNRASPVFSIRPGKVVSLSGLTIANGLISGGLGGGIYNDHSTLTLSYCNVSTNSAHSAGGIYNNGEASGGAVLKIIGCTISGNLGGGIINDGTSGGSASLMITNSTFTGNFGGVGAIYNDGGGGSATLTVVSSTISGNVGNPNGIYTDGTFAGYASTELGNCILTAGDLEPILLNDSGSFTSRGYNLCSDAAGGDNSNNPGGLLNALGDQRNTDPLLDPAGLQDNGGGTPTLSLQPASPAIDAGNSFGSLADQRGRTRPYDYASIPNASGGDGSDIGAYEAGPERVMNLNDSGPGSLRQAILSANAGDSITFAPFLTGTIRLTSGELAIGKDLAIVGPGAKTIAVSGNNASRVFNHFAGTVTISGLAISNGNATGSGGAITNAAPLTLSNCSVAGNTSAGNGGAVCNTADGILRISGCTFSGNTATTSANNGGGGAIYDNSTILGGSVSIVNSTFHGNAANGSGGGIYSATRPLLLTNCTFSGNAAASNAGAIYSSSGFTVGNTIIAGNTCPNGPNIYGFAHSLGYNLIGATDGSSGWLASGTGMDLTGIDPVLGPLQDNGGPTFTMALLPGSPAIDAGGSFGLPTDQRGQSRPYDNSALANANQFGEDGSDIGAFELGAIDACSPGTALSFDGVNDRVVVPLFGSSLPSAEVTIEFWQKATSAKAQATLALSTYNFSEVCRCLAPYSDGLVYFDFGNNHTGGQLSYAPPVSIIGTWQHFAFVASQSGNYMKIYRNGVLEAQANSMTPFVNVDNYDLALGGDSGESFSGLLDEVGIWNVARTQAQIQADMAGSLAAPQSGLVGYWRFDAGAGLTAIDSSGRGYTGTLTNGPVWVSSTVPFAPCPVAQGAVAINEIMYNPTAPNASYVEIYNNKSSSFDLSNWRLDGVGYKFPVGTYLSGHGFLVLGKDRASVANAFGVQVFAEFPGQLNPLGQTFALVNPTSGSDFVLSKVHYEPVAPWPPAANGQGSALQLIDPSQEAARVSNWSDAVGWNFASLTGNFGATSNSLGTNVDIFMLAAGEVYIDDIFLVPASGPGAGLNLLQNGDFEQDLSVGPWIISAQMSNSGRSTTYAHSGNYSLHVVATNGGSVILGRVIKQPLPPLNTNIVCTLSFWYHTGNSTNFFVRTFPGSALNKSSGFDPRPAAVTPGINNSVANSLPAYPLLWLNEVQPNNSSGPTDDFGQRDPWIELYNSGATSVSLDGYYLADNYNYTSMAQWAFPAGASISPGQFLLVWADGQPEQSTATEWHTSFRLTGSAGSVALSRVSPFPQLVDYLNYPGLGADQSYGDYPDGQPFDRRIFFSTSTAREANVSPNNRPPSVSPIADQTVTVGQTVSVAINATDPDSGQRLSYNLLRGFPTGASIDPVSGIFQWTPGAGQVGSFPFTARVTDNGTPILAASQNFTVVVVSPNHAPVLSAIGDRTVYLGQSVSLTASAADPDAGQTLSYRLLPGFPSGASIDASSGLFQWTPSGTQAPSSNPITVQAADNGSPIMTDSTSFTVVVVLPPTAAISRSGGTVTITFPTITGKNYKVQFTGDLSAPAWTDLGPSFTAGAVGTATINDDVGVHPQRFYRIVPLD